MLSIELFFKTVESEIRRKHVNFLKKQKCLPSDQGQDKPQEGSAAACSDDLIFTDKPSTWQESRRVKAFNKGIETALKVLQSEYKSFSVRIEKEEAGRKKI